jgi:hypothetical protein
MSTELQDNLHGPPQSERETGMTLSSNSPPLKLSKYTQHLKIALPAAFKYRCLLMKEQIDAVFLKLLKDAEKIGHLWALSLRGFVGHQRVGISRAVMGVPARRITSTAILNSVPRRYLSSSGCTPDISHEPYLSPDTVSL